MSSRRKAQSSAAPEPATPQPAAIADEEAQLRRKKQRILASLVVSTLAVIAAYFNLISNNYALGVIIMLYVAQRFSF